jgi:phosphoribosylaminoimidazole-succinocarboxamide synthase
VIIPAIFSNTPQLQADVRRAALSLGADVVNVKFEIGFDAMGCESIFFNVVLTDEASRPARLRFVTQHVSLTLMNQLKTDENGVHAYFNFRSQSEAASIKDPAWA